MNAGRTIFAQLMDHFPAYEFQKCVARYDGDYKFRGFSCGDQFLALAFAQLTYRESLRDIEACLRSVGGKLYHMGFRDRRLQIPRVFLRGSVPGSRLRPTDLP